LRDAQQHRIPHLVMIPCLILTFLFGPAGLLTYVVIRTLALRRLIPPTLGENSRIAT
jgi:hypothetical protein